MTAPTSYEGAAITSIFLLGLLFITGCTKIYIINLGTTNTTPPSPPCDATTPNLIASGGNITTISYNDTLNYIIHTFTNNGSIKIDNCYNCTLQALVLGGGGGGGGTLGGGGGSGGIIVNSSYPVTNGTNYTITIGQGGKGGAGGDGPSTNGDNGQDTIFSSLTAMGGGGGGTYNGGTGTTGSNGGSGGGGGADNSVDRNGGTGTSPQGHNGGKGKGINAAPYWRAGGGGGTNQTGQDYTSTTGGNGGNGSYYNITGNITIYGCGGGGGVYINYGNTGPGIGGCAQAGTGGDGPGGTTHSATNATGYGNGGGGGGYPGDSRRGGYGSQGIVIIRYLNITTCDTAPTDTGFMMMVFTPDAAQTPEEIAPPSDFFTTPNQTGGEI